MGFSRQEYWSGVPLPSPVCFLRAVESPFSGLLGFLISGALLVLISSNKHLTL